MARCREHSRPSSDRAHAKAPSFMPEDFMPTARIGRSSGWAYGVSETECLADHMSALRKRAQRGLCVRGESK